MSEEGYVIRAENCLGGYIYFRGCARGREDAWSKRICSAQIYLGYNAALKTLSNSNKINDCVRKSAKIIKIKITVE